MGAAMVSARRTRCIGVRCRCTVVRLQQEKPHPTRGRVGHGGSKSACFGALVVAACLLPAAAGGLGELTGAFESPESDDDLVATDAVGDEAIRGNE